MNVREVLTTIKSIFGKNLIGIFAFFVSIFEVGCQVSSAPVIEELIKTAAPTFSKDSLHNYTTTTTNFTLTGECDPASASLEYSFDNSNWNTISGGCANGSFTLNLIVAPQKTVYARAQTNFGPTSTAQAIIRLALLPSSTAFEFVSAAPITNDGTSVAFHGALGGTMTSSSLSNGAHKLSLGVIGVLYGN